VAEAVEDQGVVVVVAALVDDSKLNKEKTRSRIRKTCYYRQNRQYKLYETKLCWIFPVPRFNMTKECLELAFAGKIRVDVYLPRDLVSLSVAIGDACGSGQAA